MNLVEWKEAESKWKLAVDSDGLPITGYYGGYRPFMDRGGKENVDEIVGKSPVLEGSLYFKDIEKGRSSVIFRFIDDNNIDWHMTISGAVELFKSICRKNTNTSLAVNSLSNEEVYKFSGRWTIIKQGTQVSIRTIG